MASRSAIWQAEGDAKRTAVQSMFADIAPRYDLLNSLLSFRLHHRWRAHAVSLLELKPGDRALDVCCGTGDFLRPLRSAVGKNGAVAGVDFCQPMLDVARRKSGAAALVLGDASRLPIRSDSVAAVTVGWGLRNVPDLDAAHREIARVLKPGARFVSLDMAIPRNSVVKSVSRLFCGVIAPRLGALFGNRAAYEYLPASTLRFSSREQLVESMQRVGLVECRWKDLMFGNICLHTGRKPS